jgi:hypothetical protein
MLGENRGVGEDSVYARDIARGMSFEKVRLKLNNEALDARKIKVKSRWKSSFGACNYFLTIDAVIHQVLSGSAFPKAETWIGIDLDHPPGTVVFAASDSRMIGRNQSGL